MVFHDVSMVLVVLPQEIPTTLRPVKVTPSGAAPEPLLE